MKNQMRKIIKFSKRIESDIRLQVFVCVILSLIVFMSFLIINNMIDIRKSHEYTIIEDIKLINRVEDISEDKDIISLSGYAFLLEKDSADSIISLLLLGLNNGKEVWLDIDQSVRQDVNSYFYYDYNYENSGFFAEVKKNDLQLDECYELLINLDYTDISDKKVRKTVSTNRYILNGEIYTYNPYEYDEPNMNIESELLKKVFSRGALCFYQKDSGMYVYQYEDKLYWIASKDFQFDVSGLTYIPYQLATTQINRLPEDRIKIKAANMDFRFEQHEYNIENTAPYRVAVREIPNNYPITYIKTGVFDILSNTWVWTKYFHIENIQ